MSSEPKRYPMIDVTKAREFLLTYIDTFRKLVDTKYSAHKDEFPLYSKWPLEVSAFIAPRGMLVSYLTGASKFSIRVQIVSDFPKVHGSFTRFYTNRYFQFASKNPEAEVEREISFELNLDSMIEEYDRHESERLELQYLDSIKFEVGSFLKYLASAYQVKDVTFREHVYTLFELLEQVTRFANRMQLFVDVRADSLILLYDQILDDMHTSIFLAVHGKYGQAMSCLRRVLETGLGGIESDCRMATNPEGKPSDPEKWLLENQLNFAGSGGVIESLFHGSTDATIVEFLRKFRQRQVTCMEQRVKELYHELSVYVHVERSSDRQMLLSFAEYDAELFDKWHKTWEEIGLLIDLTLLLKLPETFALASKGESVGFPEFSIEELSFLQSSSRAI